MGQMDTCRQKSLEDLTLYYLRRIHWKLRGTWFQKTWVLVLAYGSLYQSFPHCIIARDSDSGSQPTCRKDRGEEISTAKEGLYESRSTPQLLFQGYVFACFATSLSCQGVLDTLYASLCVCMSVCGEHTMIFQGPSCLWRTPSLGHMNGVWRWNS